MSTTVTYKGNTLTTVNNATKTLKTAGKYMEGDVVLADSTTIKPLNVIPNKSTQTFNGETYSVIESIQCETSAVITTTENLTNQLILGKTYKAHIQWWYQPYDTVLINEGDYEFVCSSTGYTIQKNSTTVKIYPTYVTGFKGSVNINSEWVIIEISELSAYDGYLPITVDPIPSEYIIPTGTKSITENGAGIDVTQYASVDVAIPAEFDVPTFYTEDWETFTCNKTYEECLTLFNNNEHGAILTALSETSSGMTEVSTFLVGYTQRDDDGPLRYCFVQNGVPIAQIEYLHDDTINMFSPPTSVQNLNVTTNGTYSSGQNAVWNEVTVNVPSSSPSLQTKTATPTEQQQTVSPDSGYDGLSSVTVGAISSTYIGSGVDRYSSTDAIVDKESIEFPAGYYAEEHHGEVAIGTVSEQNLSVESVGHGEYAVRATVNVTEGYVPNDTKTDRLNLTSYLQTKTITPTESAQHTYPDSGKIGLFDVMVEAIPSDYVGSEITQRSSTDLTTSGATVTVPAGYYSTQASKTVASGSATVNSRITTTPSISIDEDGLVTASLNGSVGAMPVVTEGYITAGTTGSISYIGSKTLQLDTQAATTITPSTTAQTVVAAGKYTTGAITVAAMPFGTAGTPTATKGTVSNHSISVTPSVTNTTGYITGGTKNGTAVTISASELVSGTYTVDSSGTKDITNYASISVPSGSATAPASITGTAATVSTGTNTLTLTKSVSVTPSVTAGYVNSGTAGNSSVSLTASVSTKAAATITPGTTNQTIASGTYLTGTQTIAGDADLVASNIVSGVQIFGVTGNVVLQNYYTGSSAPSSSLGQNGDIYIQQ